MPKLSSLLSYTCGSLLFVYLALVGFTVFFASEETRLSGLLRDREASVSALEATYYDAIAAVSSEDPLQLGYASPSRVSYVTLGAPSLSLGTTEGGQ